MSCEHGKQIAGKTSGLVDQWKIVAFARRRPWVQIPASPLLRTVDDKQMHLTMVLIVREVPMVWSQRSCQMT